MRNLRNRHGSDIRMTGSVLDEESLDNESPPTVPMHHPSPSGSAESTLSFSSSSTWTNAEVLGDNDEKDHKAEIDMIVSCLTTVGNRVVSSGRSSSGNRSFRECRGVLISLICVFLFVSLFAGLPLSPNGIHSASKVVDHLLTGSSRVELPVLAAICTHHRTGTVLFQALGEKLCEEFLVDYERVDVPFRLDAPSSTETLLYHHYFNTSEKLVVGMHGFEEQCLSKEGPEVSCGIFDWNCWLSSCNVTNQSTGNVIPVAHLVRNPVEMLISAYLYHQQDPPPEKWLAEPKPSALEILPEDVQRKFKTVPYFQALQQLPPELGLLMEYRVEAEELFRMTRNYRDLASLNYAINIKFEDVKANYTSTVEKILDHLGITKKFGKRGVMEIASKLDINNMSKKLWNAYQVGMHVTEGKHNKSTLRQVLYKNKDMRSVMEAIGAVLEYQDVFNSKQAHNVTHALHSF
eukprot:g2384.t1